MMIGCDRRSGLSLIELMVVLLILGILAAVTVTNLTPITGQARQKLAATEIANLKQALQLFHTNHGRFPQALAELARPDPKHNGEPYIEAVPTDPWSNPYKYERVDGKYRITSLGADGARGGKGDNADIASNDLARFK